ncbi:MAG: ATP-dependent helicase [Sandaracinus sp.]|nr:ATP-dependent helicase [Sandaracinus sp.]MBJ71786.1 ATP-dependent helicase [Sandaracinus sp.]HJK91994.1 DEAD/DEAH box helicase [Polyangiaceae bacterium LLY-WYZ-15_(1-7)]HJL20847.1 DEAD/DEAH box helicase [Polyangiaceae bacterium LLY-WYZ-15_(1-7)]HJL28365.1 DEAD/DEAH box helicase [Polyangiaceae bacterium LLY-WYZ-15_(1-7)]
MAGGFDRLSGALQYQIVNTLGFSSLRPVQEQTIEAILEGDDCVVLAPTAGGKTEAAFFPLLSRMNDEDWTPVSVLYLSPIRALLNNQEDRVQRYAGLLGRRAFKWHGDVGDSARKTFLAEPTDFLLTTPESLEAMMMSPRVSARELFTGLRAVVIDEVHAFADDDRGAHLASVLERLSRFAGREVQRIGLSATVGNPGEILTWLRGGSERLGRVIDPGGAKVEPVVRLDYVATVENAAQVIEAMHRGKKRLVFVDSRRGAEELGAKLLELGVMAFVSHGSLSVTARRDAETAFAQGENCVIVATSALELGIDVGDLHHVLQIDAPPSVASYLQRMGRTGRRAEMGPANCTFLTTRDQRLLQAAAIERLRQRGFVEPVRPSRRASHILAHQIMSLAVQSGGVGREDWWGWLEGAAPFEDLTYEERQTLLDHMLHKDILTDHEGRLWLGEKGEKSYGRANFRALYAVFEAPRLITVRHASQEIGTIDATFLASLEEDDEPSSFTLGGRNWLVLDIDWRRGRCVVKPADSGKAARWSGSPRHLSYELCQTMRDILLDDEVDTEWSARAEKVIAQLRAEFYFLRDGDEFVHDNDEQITWHNFAGGAANLLLARLLEREVGGRVISRNTSLTFTKDGGKSLVAIKQAMEKLREADSPTWSDALRFAPDATKSRVSKFQPCLPDHLARDLLVRKTVDLATARVILGLDPHVDETATKFEYAKPRNPIQWVRSPDELAAIADKLHAEPFIALDVETTLTDQSLCLAQVGTPETNYLIDPFTVGDLAPLAAVLESDKVEKVIHNAQFEKTVLGKLGIGIENIYDTLTVSRRKYGPLAAGHSLLAVVRRELDLVIDKRCQTSDWRRRPLDSAQVEYAALDVEVLWRLRSTFSDNRPVE